MQGSSFVEATTNTPCAFGRHVAGAQHQVGRVDRHHARWPRCAPTRPSSCWPPARSGCARCWPRSRSSTCARAPGRRPRRGRCRTRPCGTCPRGRRAVIPTTPFQPATRLLHFLAQRHVRRVREVVVDVQPPSRCATGAAAAGAVARRIVHVDVGDQHVLEAVLVEVVDQRLAAEAVVPAAREREVRGGPRLDLPQRVVAVVQLVVVGAVVGHDEVQPVVVVEVAHRHEVGRLVRDHLEEVEGLIGSGGWL